MSVQHTKSFTPWNITPAEAYWSVDVSGWCRHPALARLRLGRAEDQVMLPRSRYPALLATLAVCAASTLSCKAHRTGVADARVLHITTSDYAFDAPAQLESGLVSIELFNRGPNLHEAQLLKLGAGKTLKDFSDSLGL